jgi:hypothetical protein
VLDAAVRSPRGPSRRGRGPEVPYTLVPPYHRYQVGGEVVAARLDGLHVVDPDGPVPSGVETHVRVFLFQPGPRHAPDLFYYCARTTPLLGRGIESIHVLHNRRFFGKSLQSRGFFGQLSSRIHRSVLSCSGWESDVGASVSQERLSHYGPVLRSGCKPLILKAVGFRIGVRKHGNVLR